MISKARQNRYSICLNTGCISELGDFATLFFLVRQHWGGHRYRHFAANFKAF
jgi:hypothetical protein